MVLYRRSDRGKVWHNQSSWKCFWCQIVCPFCFFVCCNISKQGRMPAALQGWTRLPLFQLHGDNVIVDTHQHSHSHNLTFHTLGFRVGCYWKYSPIWFSWIGRLAPAGFTGTVTASLIRAVMQISLAGVLHIIDHPDLDFFFQLFCWTRAAFAWS